MSFEVFDARVHGRDRRVVTTSPKNGVLRFSTALFRDVAAERVLLLFDPVSGRIGVRAAGADDPRSLPVHPRSLAVGCTAFLSLIGESDDDRVWPMVPAVEGGWVSD